MATSDTLTSFGSFDLQDIIEIALRRWRWVAVGGVVGLALGAAAYMVLPRSYEATTTILVEPQGVPESYVRSTITLDVDQRIRTLHQRVTSHKNLNDLIDLVGAERLDPTGRLPRDVLMNEIAENLSVSVEAPRERERGASIVEIRFEGEHPDVLADSVRQIADLFIAENRKDRAQQAASTSEFLETELSRIRFEVTAQESRIRDFRTENIGALPSQLDANNRELDRLSEALSANLESQERLAGQMTLLRGGEGGVAAPGSLSAALQSARGDLMEAKRVYTENHPNILSLRAQIKQMEEELADELAATDAGGRSTDPALAQDLQAVKLALASRSREEDHLRGRIAETERNIAKTPKNEQRLLELTRDYETLQDTYKLLLGNKHDAALARNLEAAQMAEQFKLLRPARTPTEPYSPDPFVVIPAGFAGGLALSLLLILWSEIRTPAFHSVETLARRLGLPVFAAIPDLDRDRIYDGFPLPEQLDWRLVVACAPNSAAAEQYRGFAPHFLEREKCRTILVTSAQPGDGKSITCTNLACTLAADVGRRVLLIDADLRRATQHKIAGVEREPGLSDVLLANADLRECVRPLISNLSLLPAGTSPENPLALLTSEAFLKLCEQAAENYEVVLIDSPPILPVIDAKILRRMADMVVFVVRAGVSPSGGVMRSMRELSGVGGVVFNRVSSGAFKRYYYYDAYSQYEYSDSQNAGDQPSRDVED
jgi:polysaccharide chain length determinant protein (PEP-CTERM system associated)